MGMMVKLQKCTSHFYLSFSEALSAVSSTYVSRDGETRFKVRRRNVEVTEDIFCGCATDRTVAGQHYSRCCLSYVSNDKNDAISKVSQCAVVSDVSWQQSNQLSSWQDNVCLAILQLQQNQQQHHQHHLLQLD